ncbi:MAG: hypothetical protein GY851_31425, partial [bacterium]|nr:hypothetical protein [bacterium]
MWATKWIATGVVCLVAAGLLGCPLAKDSADLAKNPDDDYGDKPVFLVDLENTSGVEDGLTWDTAFTQIHRAIAAAEKIYGGAEVWVAEGRYRQLNENGCPRRLEMASAVDLYGGFVGIGPSGYETERSQRDWEDHESRIQGWYSIGDFLIGSGFMIIGTDAVLDGFTVTGFMHGLPCPGPYCAFYSNDASPEIRNCRFGAVPEWDDGAPHELSHSGCGLVITGGTPRIVNCSFVGLASAIWCSESTPSIVGCHFEANEFGISNEGSDAIVEGCAFKDSVSLGGSGAAPPFRTHGTAMYNRKCSPSISGCVFDGNRVEGNPRGYGAAVCNFLAAPSFSHCVFSNNESLAPGGAIHFGGRSGAPILGERLDLIDGSFTAGGAFTDCTFTGNSAPLGGAVASFDVDVTFTRCTFTGNTADYGGAVHHTLGTATFVDCVFDGNAGTEQGGSVHAVKMGGVERFYPDALGAEFLNTGVASAFTGCIFRDNVAPYGGAVCSMDGAELTFDACRFSGNVGDMGGAVMNTYAGASTSLVNCVLDHNTATAQGGAICIGVGPLDLMNCTVANNAAPEGPAVMFTGRGLTLTNTVLWDGVHEGLNGFIKVPDGLIPGNAETV